ncbi:Protein dehydration-induced 19, C-terminal [Sesbania bispinosa]|nr:Protein dehydration-induced 19, C-terminal [Sesbania bispinosa]
MDADSSWSSRLSSASKRYLQSRSEMFMGFDENDGDDDIREEFLCPFCSEYFDIVGLCCHIDEEHPVEAKNGGLALKVLVALHILVVCTMHLTWTLSRSGWYVVYNARNSLTNEYMQRKRKSRKSGSYSTLSLLRKELREGNLQSLFGGSSCIVSSTNAAPDPLLSSFILPVADEFSSSQRQPNFLSETRQSKKSSDETVSKQNAEASTLSVEDKEEKAKRCEFVQGLLLSTMLDDIL